MSISLAGLAVQPYVGAPFGQPVQIAGVAGRAVKFNVTWLSYNAGSNNQDIVISANCSAGAGTNQTNILDLIRSVYIDNTGNPLPIYIQFPDTGFTVAAAPFSTGWYPVFTNQFSFNIVGLGFTNANVQAQNGALNATLIYVTNIKVTAYSDTALQSVENQELASPVLGGGSSLSAIIISATGALYLSDAISITGGGGSGGAAHGTLDQWGQFSAAVLDTPGNGYSSLPIVLATGSRAIAPVFNPLSTYNPGPGVNYANIVAFNNALWYWNGNAGEFQSIECGAANWVSTNETYVTGNQVNYLGNIYAALRGWALGDSGNPPATNISAWLLLGSATPATGTQNKWVTNGAATSGQASFMAVLSAASSAISTSGLGPPALGDQAANFIDNITGTGVFRDNLFGTPASSGFIYLTHIDVNALTFNAGNVWDLVDALGYSPFSFSPQAAGRYMSLQKMNMKLDATQDWKLVCSNFAGDAKVSHAFAWTYSRM